MESNRMASSSIHAIPIWNFVKSHSSSIGSGQFKTPKRRVTAGPSVTAIGLFFALIWGLFMMSYCGETKAHAELTRLAEKLQHQHLRDLLQDERRNSGLYATHDGIHLDLSRQQLDTETLAALLTLADELQIGASLERLFNGHKINATEKRAVLHPALRASSGDKFTVDDKDVVADVLEVRNRIKRFSAAVRGGEFKGHSGKSLTDLVCVGIGGSYLGVEFVLEAIKTHPPATSAAKGRRLRFLANVDPIDVTRALDGLCPETTLVVVISKTFTTAETMLNAHTLRNWILKHYNNDESAVAKHFCGVSTALKLTSDFGLKPENVFGFWDWVGGRFSVSSAVGVLPLALHFGFDIVEEFLEGARDMDLHARHSPPAQNLPMLMGLASAWNAAYLKHSAVAVLPYCQALHRFPAHIQQLTMESNGKRVTVGGSVLPSADFGGEIFFGEPGTNGQHSFYQLIHQGRVVPCEFIGFTQSQTEVKLPNQPVSNHQELMSNFFAQPDALALGKTEEELRAEGVPEVLVPHKTFPGNRPSMSLLFEGPLTPRRAGQLLSLYEHRTAVEGFLFGVNSFDQWGVELGKVLAKGVRGILQKSNEKQDISAETSRLVKPTQRLLNVFLHH
eukprot:Protomagalhaensia_sp_Gyna_25__4505@NODE_413_length_3509_cov_255_403458_g319_i0_p1_GENE_NODE_413_length_3509_cov_255_403458_g319_i0NODE_413_length_3509_cov_255_403458_g319_i0_p1_ORF_typecomplete_len619_score136_79PGI/PF00342_19/7_8e118LZ3wCH/PF18517_1/0_35_NODE_413_length_3509_cov_255_403458_g319_i01472003